MSTYKKISEISSKTSGLTDNDYLTGIDYTSGENANFTLSTLKSYFQTKLESVFAKLASPTLTGTPKAPTAADRNNTTQIATTAFVQKEITYQKNQLNHVDKNGDIMSGTLKVSKTSENAQVTAEETASGASSTLMANTSGQAGLYDSGHSKWIISTDSTGNIHIPITPQLINNTKRACTTVGTAYEYDSAPLADLANWNIVAVWFVVHEHTQFAWFIRGVKKDNTLTDSPSGGRIRGSVIIDWDNNKIGIRCLNGGSSGNLYGNVYYQGVYGIL